MLVSIYFVYMIVTKKEVSISALLFIIPIIIALIESYSIEKHADAKIEKLETDLKNYNHNLKNHGHDLNIVEL